MIVIAILGLLIPGYVLARALRSPVAWAVAYPLSVLVLTEIVIAYTLLGIPIRFGGVLNAVLGVVIVSFAIQHSCKPNIRGALDDTEQEVVTKSFKLLAGGLVGLTLLGIFVRTTLYPLSGPDTAFRWDALPRAMLKYEGLSYYPPVTGSDFAKYTWPESFPPLVATVYWWLYAAWGGPFPRITSVAIVLQAASCFALVFYGARILFGSAGSVLSLIVLSSSIFFLNGVAIGQENGYTALSYAGQLLFAFAAIRQPKASLVAIAGLFAGLGALAREYGPLLSLCGFAALACRFETRRYLPLFVLVATVVAAPWYIRNWVLTGNPWYSLDVLGFPVNPVFAGITSVYRDKLGWSNVPAFAWLVAAKSLLMGAPLVLLLGVPGIYVAGRNGIAFGVAGAIAFLLWFLSIPSTSGGIGFTWRVLTPMCVAFSMAAGAFGPKLLGAIWQQRIVLRAITWAALIVCGVFALAHCWTQPSDPSNFIEAVLKTRNDPLNEYGVQESVAETLQESTLPEIGVLTDDNPLAIALQRNSRFHPVMIYSPEVAFVFDPRLKADEVRRRLIDKDIWLVSITFHSLNNYYLNEYPFYRDLFNNWQPLLTFGDKQSIVFLPKDKKPASDPGAKP